jgi:hypothetical protein
MSGHVLSPVASVVTEGAFADRAKYGAGTD